MAQAAERGDRYGGKGGVNKGAVAPEGLDLGVSDANS